MLATSDELGGDRYARGWPTVGGSVGNHKRAATGAARCVGFSSLRRRAIPQWVGQPPDPHDDPPQPTTALPSSATRAERAPTSEEVQQRIRATTARFKAITKHAKSVESDANAPLRDPIPSSKSNAAPGPKNPVTVARIAHRRWPAARALGGCYRIDILSRFRTGQGLGPAAIAGDTDRERGGRHTAVVSSHTLMYRSGSEGRLGEGR